MLKKIENTTVETFDTPEEVEIAFYECLEVSDINRMKQVWLEDDSIVCIHPGAMRLEGRADVVESFSHMFKDAPAMDFVITDVKCTVVENLAIHLVREEVAIDDQLVSVMLATNIYHRVDGSWRMTLHHASHEPDYDEFEEHLMDVDTPIVLH